MATGASTSVNSFVAIARINGPTLAPLTPAREIQPLVSSPLQVTNNASPVKAIPWKLPSPANLSVAGISKAAASSSSALRASPPVAGML